MDRLDNAARKDSSLMVDSLRMQSAVLVGNGACQVSINDLSGVVPKIEFANTRVAD